MHQIETFLKRAGAATGETAVLVVEQLDNGKFQASIVDNTDRTAPVSFESDWDIFAVADGSTVADALANLDALCATDNAAVA